MKKIIENIKFMQDETMVFGDLYLENGYVERIDYKTTPHMVTDIAIPGFIDIHTHGCQGYVCDDSTPIHLKEMAQAYAKRGITSFCATLSARPLQEYAKIIDIYRMVFQGETYGAEFVGFHLEGPYLNPHERGAAELEMLREINIAELEIFLANYHDEIKIMTLAPELKNADEAIQLLHLYGIEVSLGHTNATFEQTLQAFSLGASQITHLGNDMPMLDQRHKSMMDAIFLSDCICEIIMDRIHMQEEMLRWMIILLGSKRIIAVGNGSSVSDIKLKDMNLKNNMPHLNRFNCPGVVPQSSHCDMLDIFQYLYKERQYDLQDCLRMCCTNAAKMLHCYTATIDLGKRVNLVVLDHNVHIKDVIIHGKSVL